MATLLFGANLADKSYVIQLFGLNNKSFGQKK
jgi:hypothetical protein